MSSCYASGMLLGCPVDVLTMAQTVRLARERFVTENRSQARGSECREAFQIASGSLRTCSLFGRPFKGDVDHL